MREMLEKIADWKMQVGLGFGSAGVSGVTVNSAMEHGVTMYHWIAQGVSLFGALVGAASLGWKIYTYYKNKKPKE